ncbi:uncharacterized protein LOC125845705 [Solanum stenotomum]|uniref:uncharacterized protein LOC125845705 n=1 Tax=Solanum stenotomum TaxID=172797 RepID=UPI0020D1D43B|nr:uncharacterized protein LOC125845705 [Solanum stenotomum]
MTRPEQIGMDWNGTVSILFDRGSLFTSNFWKALQYGLGTQLDMSIAFNPYTDDRSKRTVQRVRALVFMKGDHVWLQVSPMKGVMRFRKKVKLSPIFIGPFDILSRVREVVYKLALPPILSIVHHVFDVSMLQKYVSDESYVLSLDSVELGPDLSFEEDPIAILDRQVRKLRTKDIASVKVHWKHHSVGEVTWDT